MLVAESRQLASRVLGGRGRSYVPGRCRGNDSCYLPLSLGEPQRYSLQYTRHCHPMPICQTSNQHFAINSGIDLLTPTSCTYSSDLQHLLLRLERMVLLDMFARR